MFNWLKKKVAIPSAERTAEKPTISDHIERGRSLRRQGNAWLDKGDLGAAVASYEQAVALDPQSADSRTSLGYALSQLERFDEAQQHLTEALRLDPASADAFYLLGIAHRAKNHIELAVAAWQSALAVKPDFEACRRDLIFALAQHGDLASAQATALAGLAISPRSADMPYLLGNIHTTRGELAEAATRYEEALALNPGYAQAHQALAEVQKQQGNLTLAVESFRRSVALNPASAEARLRLAAALHGNSEFDAAIALYGQALALDPNQAEGHANLGYALQQTGQADAAVASYQRAIALRPDLAEAHTNLGNVLSELGRLGEGVASYERALALKPDDGRTHSNLAATLVCQGRLDEAVTGFERALELDPEYVTAYSNLLFALNYHPDRSAEQIFEAYRGFEQRFATKWQERAPPHTNDRTPARRLKVGYLSPDFRRHAVHLFLSPLFDHRDSKVIEVHAYSDVLVDDEITAFYKRSAHQWVPVAGQTDEQVAARIRADGIDILVDLAGHTGKNRLGVFARKPAPVQVSWLGFGYTTGLTAIDYFLTDGTAAPPGSEHLFAEQVWRMAAPSYAYRPNTGMGECGASPAAARGFVTFGTLTRAIRMNHRVVAAWSRILQRVPGSRMVIDSVNFQDAFTRDALLASFAAHGIGPQRLDVGFHSPPWDLFRGIDIGLDCFPHNSGTTLFETLYMGLPYVTLSGRPSVGRLGSSILVGAGHPEWIAHSEDEYIDKAVALASDMRRLAELRDQLRADMQASPLMDEPGFARKVEAAYRSMFTRWAEAPA